MTWLAENPVLSVILFIGFLVFVHETGHFLVGKAFGIGVEIYSIGFGPKLFGFEHKGTEYRLAFLPLGGFVKFAGTLPSEDVPDHFKGREMYKSSVLARALTILAGPAANLMLAAVIYSFHGYQGVEHPPAQIGMIMPGGGAEKGGLMVGDIIKTIDGEPVAHWNDLRSSISRSPDKTLNVTVLRDQKSVDLQLTPEPVGRDEISGQRNRGRLGISPGILPSVVTPLTLKGMEPSQIEAGDRIKSLEFAGTKMTVKTWHDFLKGLNEAKSVKAETLLLTLFRPEALASAEKSKDILKPEGHKAQEGKTVQVTLSTAPWWETPFPEELGRVSLLKELATRLGLSDSQLTLSEVMNPLDMYLKPMDKLLAFNGKPLENIFSLHEMLEENKNQEASVRILRNGEILEQTIRMEPVEVQKAEGKVTLYRFSVAFLGQAESPEPYIEKYDSFFSAASYGIKETAVNSGAIIGGIWGLITGTLPLKALGGPMLIAKVAGDAAEAGFQAFFTAMAIISINLGVLNLFPIPALDGGQLLLVGAEAVRRRPLNEAAIENFQKVGFVMIMALVVLATYNDLSRFWGAMLKQMSGLMN